VEVVNLWEHKRRWRKKKKRSNVREIEDTYGLAGQLDACLDRELLDHDFPFPDTDVNSTSLIKHHVPDLGQAKIREFIPKHKIVNTHSRHPSLCTDFHVLEYAQTPLIMHPSTTLTHVLPFYIQPSNLTSCRPSIFELLSFKPQTTKPLNRRCVIYRSL
jgi:hypothetical protein